MNEIFTYTSTNRRRVSVGYRLPDGKTMRLYRKIDGNDRDAIQQAIDDVKAQGVKEVIVEAYRPNGSAEVICKTFTIPNNGTAPNTTLGNVVQPKLFDSDERENLTPSFRTQSKISKPMERPFDSWKDYALKTEQEKTSKLENENRRLLAENKTLDTKVREFEKEMIKKDHEVEKLTQSVENKSGLNGFVERAAESPQVMTLLAGMASRMMGIPMDQTMGQPQINGSPELTNPQTEQYLVNIRAWLYKQPEDVQEIFYQLVYHLTNSSDVKAASMRLINVLKGNPMTGTHN
ncbi:MAG: TMF family protein [Bacteroidetes bacterium]|nr:TMF family protein [Bacteroidota bacterium]